jgi:hypothetical protein
MKAKVTDGQTDINAKDKQTKTTDRHTDKYVDIKRQAGRKKKTDIKTGRKKEKQT